MLNPSQQEAVEHRYGPALVLAGAGAGKTSVLTQRVATLLKYGVTQPHNMLVVTFTNKAAKEMKERLAKLLGWKQVKQLSAGTFHSIGCRILRQHIEGLNIGYGKNFGIYDSKDQEKTMDLAIRSLNLDPKDYQAYKMLQVVGKYKNAGIDPDAIAPGSVDDPFEIRIYRQYQMVLKQNNAVDFDDILFLTLRLLQENDEIRQQLQDRYEQVLVDEYQDTNSVQFELIRLLGAKHRNIFVVGDVDQSIYSFRNANFRIILRFQEDYPDAKIIKLEENYRSTGAILNAANDLIQNNRERFEKTLIATRGEGTPIRFHQALNEDEESTFIAKQIQRLNEEDGILHGHMAILYRTNAMSRVYEQRLIQFAIPYHVVGGYKFYDRREIKDMLGYLHVLHNPYDSLSLKRIINTPKRGLGEKAMETLETSASYEGRGLTLWEGLQTERVVSQLTSSKAQDAVRWLVGWLKLLRKDKPSISVLLERIYNESGYRAEIETDPDTKKRQDRHENAQALIQSAIEFETDAEDKTDVGAFLERVALFSDTDNLKSEGKAVNLMTVHGAKGLEFPIVFIPAVEEGVFPHIRSITDPNSEAAIEEERRLMYVALTRAKNRLFLTFASQRRSKRATTNSKLSRFMIEISKHLTIPGELMVAYRQQEYEQRQKKMNLKGFSDLAAPRQAMEPKSFGATQSPMQATRSMSSLPPISPVKQPAAPAAPISPMVQALQAKAAQAMQAGRVASNQLQVQQTISTAKRTMIQLQAGEQVSHPEFGIGKVEKVIPPLAKIQFESGMRTLNLASAPLAKC